MAVDLISKIGIDTLIHYSAATWSDAWNGICTAIIEDEEFLPPGYTFTINVIKVGTVYNAIATIYYSIVE